MTRILDRITATTDVHSQLDGIAPLLAHLHAERKHSLIADCGDFFEGSGFHTLGDGQVEQQILTQLYDVVAPGNHGWQRHFTPELHAITVCANAVEAATGKPLFTRIHRTVIGGRSVAVTVVIGEQAFSAIPAVERAGHDVTDPATALRRLYLELHHEIDAWILLSHSGFDHDLELAETCPFLDIVFAGHCHSDQYRPVPVGDTLVLKGLELAAGYAIAEPVGSGWAAHTCTFTDGPVCLPAELAPISARINALREQLAQSLGPLAGRWQHTTLDRVQLLYETARRLHTGIGAPAVILNETALRPIPLGEELSQGDLLSLAPFGNQLVHVQIPADTDLPFLLALLDDRAGCLVTVPHPLPTGTGALLTTDYLAETITTTLGGQAYPAEIRLDQAVRHILTAQEGEPA